MKKIFKKVSLSLFIGFISLFLSLEPVLADFDWPDPSDAAKEAMDGIIEKYGIDDDVILESVQNFNTIRQKKQPPKASVTFSPENPVAGEKITAIAQPEYFGNEVDNLYFTWFIKHESCPYEDGCDFNDDDKINIEDYKIEAGRIMANNEFDWEEEPYNSDNDDDGYKAVFGGDDQRNVGKDSHCFFHDFKNGSEYEFSDCKHLFPEEGDLGDGTFGRSEEKFWHTNPDDPDTADTGHVDEANVIGLGRQSFSWTYQEGDEVGVAIEGISFEPTAYDDASYKVMWALSKNNCDTIDDAFNDPDENGSESISVSHDKWPDCPDGCDFTRTVTNTTTSFDQAPSSSYQIGTTTTEVTTQQINIHSRTSSTGTATAEGGTGGDTPTGGTATIEIGEETSDYEESLPPAETCLALDGVSNQSCCPSGYGCSILSTRTETTNSEKSMSIDLDNNLFKMSMDDFNRCLKDNFISPTEGGGKNEKIETSLSYLPQNPINDPDSINSDEISISSSIANSDDSEFLYYAWEIFTTTEDSPPIESKNWTQVTKSGLTNASLTNGLGANKLSFLLDFDEDITYIKVKLKVSESAYNGTRKGNDEIIIPLNQNSERIRIFPVEVSNDLTLSHDPDSEICFDSTKNEMNPICYVAKNQILAVQVDGTDLNNFSWTKDGRSLSYDYAPSLETAPNPAYFAVEEENGDQFNVSLSANDADGKKINLTRSFEVENPEITIVSADETTCKPTLLGYYTDADGTDWPDYSQDRFQSTSGSTINLKALSTVGGLDNEITWYVDGIETGTGTTTSFEAEKESGESYSVIATATYEPDINTAQALEKFWDVPLSYFYSTNMSDTITIKLATSSEEMAQKINNQALASLFLSLPSYSLFLFRLIVSALVIIFVTKVLFLLSIKKDEI